MVILKPYKLTVVPKVFHNPNSVPALIFVIISVSSDSKVVGNGTSAFSIGPKVTKPIKAIVDVAALSNNTGGGLEAFTNEACKAGLLLLKRNVMKPIVNRPLVYSASEMESDFCIEASSKRDFPVIESDFCIEASSKRDFPVAPSNTPSGRKPFDTSLLTTFRVIGEPKLR